MKALFIVYLLVGAISFVLGDIKEPLAAVWKASPDYVAVAQSGAESLIRYVGLLGAAGIVALPALPQTVKDKVASSLTGSGGTSSAP